MASFLEQVCATTRARVSVARRDEPLEQVRSRALATPPPPDFRAALCMLPAIIAELKRASPSRGALGTIADPAARARAYADGGAAAISVLTEPSFFQGSMDDLAAVVSAVDIPVLRKDFVLDPYQVWETRAAGASSVLVIVAALPQPALGRVLEATVQAGVSALIEAHTTAEVACALEVTDMIEGVQPVIGINTRDLRRLAVDPAVFPAVRRAVPAGWLVVAESGVSGPHDVSRYVRQGADAVLVGEYLMAAPDPQAAVRDLVSAVGGATRVPATVTAEDRREG